MSTTSRGNLRRRLRAWRFIDAPGDELFVRFRRCVA